mmetsp:Transcript_32400/g.70837  ORF Transcript_32400/g.70837 Transcript_32400/m.70837 type:complete len:212 (-) Transcript_32400:269-904(-)
MRFDPFPLPLPLPLPLLCIWPWPLRALTALTVLAPLPPLSLPLPLPLPLRTFFSLRARMRPRAKRPTLGTSRRRAHVGDCLAVFVIPLTFEAPLVLLCLPESLLPLPPILATPCLFLCSCELFMTCFFTALAATTVFLPPALRSVLVAAPRRPSPPRWTPAALLALPSRDLDGRLPPFRPPLLHSVLMTSSSDLSSLDSGRPGSARLPAPG